MMPQKNRILIAAVSGALAVGILIGVGVYYYIFSPGVLPQYQTQNDEIIAKKAAEEAARKAKFEKEINAAFPDFVKGTILISADESTLKTTDGKEYLLWPTYSSKYYTDNGLSNNQEVELQGKIMPKDDKFKRDRLFIKPFISNYKN